MESDFKEKKNLLKWTYIFIVVGLSCGNNCLTCSEQSNLFYFMYMNNRPHLKSTGSQPQDQVSVET